MSQNLTIKIEDIEFSLNNIGAGAENTATKIPNVPMSPNELLLTDKILQINMKMQKVLDQYKILLLENIHTTKKSAHEIVRADEKIGQEIAGGGR